MLYIILLFRSLQGDDMGRVIRIFVAIVGSALLASCGGWGGVSATPSAMTSESPANTDPRKGWVDVSRVKVSTGNELEEYTVIRKKCDGETLLYIAIKPSFRAGTGVAAVINSPECKSG